MSLYGVSIIIITNGNNSIKTIELVESINFTFKKANLNYEIILSGKYNANFDGLNLIFKENIYAAENGYLGSLRNSGAEISKYNILVFCDDDILFDKNWASNFAEYKKNNDFEILGNQVRLMDGGRYWDRVTVKPHKMIDYDAESFDGVLYQSGAYWIIKKYIWDKEKWNEDIPFYATKKGYPANEDVEYSLRLHDAGYKFSFDKNNIVYHNDDKYMQLGDVCVIKKYFIKK